MVNEKICSVRPMRDQIRDYQRDHSTNAFDEIIPEFINDDLFEGKVLCKTKSGEIIE